MSATSNFFRSAQLGIKCLQSKRNLRVYLGTSIIQRQGGLLFRGDLSPFHAISVQMVKIDLKFSPSKNQTHCVPPCIWLSCAFLGEAGRHPLASTCTHQRRSVLYFCIPRPIHFSLLHGHHLNQDYLIACRNILL